MNLECAVMKPMSRICLIGHHGPYYERILQFMEERFVATTSPPNAICRYLPWISRISSSLQVVYRH
jgi:hypothetical protein